VIVDIDPLTMNLDPDQVERAIGDRTRGIMLVHVYGNPCDMSALQDIARRRSLALVEDCCEALGAYYDGRSVGSFGRVGAFSFYFSHHITTLEGGMCVTAEDDLADMMRILRAHGWVREVADPDRYLSRHTDIDPRFLFVNLGYNLRATELQGGFGYVQLGKLEQFVDVRADNAAYWQRELAPLSEVFGFQQETPRGTHSWFGFPMTVKEAAPFSVDDLRVFLTTRGIESRPIIAGNIADQPAMDLYEHRVVGELPHSSHIMKNGFTFGNHQGIDEAAREYVASVLHDFAAERGVS
jgi:CDP-6-deoxy-D-xylo-4-hexulose-3-dehydrase